jgi:HK97 family phage prohead protease
MEIVRKLTVAEAAGSAADMREVREYVISDGSLDRYGTVINPSGWDLREFAKNNIAFFNHDKNFPIGTWENVRVEGGRLLGQLRLAAEGTSARIDEIIRLVRQGIIKAVSVGFRPKAKEPLKRSDGTPIPGGIHYIRQELLEASLVASAATPTRSRSHALSTFPTRRLTSCLASTPENTRRSLAALLPSTAHLLIIEGLRP